MNTQQELEMVRKIADERAEFILQASADGRLYPPKNEDGGKLVFLLCNFDLDEAMRIKLESDNG